MTNTELIEALVACGLTKQATKAGVRLTDRRRRVPPIVVTNPKGHASLSMTRMLESLRQRG